jgi:quinoprotein glucose dehydrogenase
MAVDPGKDGEPVAYRRTSPLGAGSVNARFWNPAKQMPCQQPPWSELMAVNANTGDLAWRVPLGTSDEMDAKGIIIPVRSDKADPSQPPADCSS